MARYENFEEQRQAAEEAPVPPSVGTPFGDAYQTYGKLLNTMRQFVYLRDGEGFATLSGIATGGHVLMDAQPGTGKTFRTKVLSEAIGGTANRQQGSDSLTAFDVTGSEYYNQKTGQYEFRRGPIFSNIFLADELHRSSKDYQAGILEAMEEGQVTVAGKTYQLDTPFTVYATRNSGKQLDPAVRDRFKTGFAIPPYGKSELRDIGHKVAGNRGVKVSRVAEAAEIMNLQEQVEKVSIGNAEELRAADIVEETFKDRYIDHERSVEGGARHYLDILNVAQFVALSKGRQNAAVADINMAAPLVLPHRLATNYEAFEAGENGGEYITPLVIVKNSIARVSK